MSNSRAARQLAKLTGSGAAKGAIKVLGSVAMEGVFLFIYTPDTSAMERMQMETGGSSEYLSNDTRLEPGGVSRMKGNVWLWDNYARHPIISFVSREFSQYKPTFSIDDCNNYKWTIDLFEEHHLDIELMPNSQPSEAGRFGFQPSIHITSSYQSLVNQAVGVKDFDPPCVLSVSLAWLMTVWEPVAGSFSDNFRVWQDLETSACESVAKKLLCCFQSHVLKLVSLIDSPEKLAKVLGQLESFPGSGIGTGPISSMPNIFSAIIYHKIGKLKLAIDKIEKELLIIDEEASLSPGLERDFSERRHTVMKYRKWITDN